MEPEELEPRVEEPLGRAGGRMAWAEAEMGVELTWRELCRRSWFDHFVDQGPRHRFEFLFGVVVVVVVIDVRTGGGDFSAGSGGFMCHLSSNDTLPPCQNLANFRLVDGSRTG